MEEKQVSSGKGVHIRTINLGMGPSTPGDEASMYIPLELEERVMNVWFSPQGYLFVVTAR